jgi:antitoxin FitA
MAQLIVRNLEDDVKIRLRRRATRHGRSMEEEVRDILRNAAKADRGGDERLGSRFRTLFAGVGLDQDIVPLRGQKARAARFKK